MIVLRHNSIIFVTSEKVCVFTLVKMHALFSILSRVTGIVSQQSEPLHFSVRSFGCALFYCQEVQSVLNIVTASTEELRQILRGDLEHPNQGQDIDVLFEVIGELEKRRGCIKPHSKTDRQAWQEFLKYYAPRELFGRERQPMKNSS